jgi:hypothetical protein
LPPGLASDRHDHARHFVTLRPTPGRLQIDRWSGQSPSHPTRIPPPAEQGRYLAKAAAPSARRVRKAMLEASLTERNAADGVDGESDTSLISWRRY